MNYLIDKLINIINNIIAFQLYFNDDFYIKLKYIEYNFKINNYIK